MRGPLWRPAPSGRRAAGRRGTRRSRHPCAHGACVGVARLDRPRGSVGGFRGVFGGQSPRLPIPPRVLRSARAPGDRFRASASTRRMVRLHLIATLLAPAALLACPSAEAKVTARVAGQILTVQGGKGADRVKVVCGADANVKANGRDPRTGPVLCSQVVEVDAVMRDGDDRVDLSGVDGAFGETDLADFGSASAFNLVLGGPGDDRILGGALRDHLVGGRGEDLLRGRAGNDLLLGGQGDDRILGGPGDDLISANQGDDSLFGGAGADLLGGGSGDDRLLGGPGPDRRYGGPGRDVLFGGSGNDLLVGGPGKDRLDGGPGDNVLVQGLPKAK